MKFHEILYQIYPLGCVGAPFENDHRLEHRITQFHDWIPHLNKLGITMVLFNPILQCSTHAYTTTSFSQLDCRLGTNEDFKKLCDDLHEHHIKVMLDGVFNHVGREFPYFQDVIEHKYDSPYKDWFHINFNDTNHPDGFYYEGWEGHQELVKLNLQNPAVRQYLMEQVDNWIAIWNIDGLRLDVAYMLDHTFMAELTSHIRANHPDFLFIGEMINGDYRTIMDNNLLDSVTNYECRKGLFSSMNTHNLFEIAYSLNRQFGSDPWCLYRGKNLLSFVDNHDVDRLASILEDKRDIPLTYALMNAMPGMPCYYYGSEWGIEGKRSATSDQDLRPAIKLPEWNNLTDTIQELNTLRNEHDVFTNGNYHQEYLTNEQFVFSRENDQEVMYFLLNIADHPVDLQIPNDTIHLEGKSYQYVIRAK